MALPDRDRAMDGRTDDWTSSHPIIGHLLDWVIGMMLDDIGGGAVAVADSSFCC